MQYLKYRLEISLKHSIRFIVNQFNTPLMFFKLFVYVFSFQRVFIPAASGCGARANVMENEKIYATKWACLCLLATGMFMS